MTKQIKVFFVFLAVIAVVSVISFFDIFKIAKSGILDKQYASLTTPEPDEDGDGLTNSDESYWNTDFQNPDTDGDGFLDGEEVASGHNPMVPAPNDILLNLNVTQRVADLAIAGLVEGSLKPGSANYEQSLNDLSTYIIDSTLADFAPKIDFSKLIVTESTRENQIAYAKSIRDMFQLLIKLINEQVTNLMSNPQNLLITTEDNNTAPDSYFLNMSNDFEKIYNQILLMPVPASWKEYHISILASLDQLSKTNKSIAHRADDPVSAAVAYNLWGEAYDNISGLVQSFSDKIIQENLIDGLTE